LFDYADQVRCHQEKLAHGGHIHHLRMNGHNHAGGGIQCSHGQEAELGRAVDHDDVIVIVDFTDRACNAPEEDLFRTPSSLHHMPRCLMLEFHELQIPRHDADSGKVGATDNIPHWNSKIVVANGAI